MKSIFVLCVCVIALVSHARSQSCSAEFDVDYLGVGGRIDISYQWATSFQECCAFCDANQRCHFWTYVFSTRVCWLKHSVGMRVSSPGSLFDFDIF